MNKTDINTGIVTRDNTNSNLLELIRAVRFGTKITKSTWNTNKYFVPEHMTRFGLIEGVYYGPDVSMILSQDPSDAATWLVYKGDVN